MRSPTTHIFLAAWLCCMAFLASCSNDSAQDDGENGKQLTNVTLTLVMGNAQANTRTGTWGDDDYTKETATTWENTIASDKLQVLVFDTSNNYIGQVVNLTYEGNTPDNIYRVRGVLLIDRSLIVDSKLSCKFVVLANYDESVWLTVGTSMSELETTSYQYNASGIAAKTAYIPMWGVETYQGTSALTIDENSKAEIDAGEIFMLRAMSQIRVSLEDSENNDFTIKSATLSSYNTKGYILPSGFATVSETKNLFYDVTTSPLSHHPYDSKYNSDLAFHETTTTDGTSFIIYVPECATNKDTSTGKTDPYISVTISPKKGGSSWTATDEHTYKINLHKYDTYGNDTNEKYDLIRNTIYDYKISVTGVLQYQAIDWTEQECSDVIFE